ncbi:hypothetical protein BJF89_17055 [Corynebacterium sp. CNJ-954]|uniref:YbjN domain-containing protein n=1 Tax=Corynebacterium sp. CNJ-954 TaxID=1904962 RepID=UPI00095EE4F4|nr:YbjN domain-containing protein [Corynebacterium sp. CNJ-954]OLT54283.1 hypothetical protein BJF89_17055 [Corynebacterium sp. CNJ-954]
MFSFGKKNRVQRQKHDDTTSTPQRDTPDDTSRTSTSVTPGDIEAPLAANAVQLVAAGAGLTTVNTGSTVWLHCPAIGLQDLDLGALDMRIEVSGSANEPLTHNVVMEFDGVLDDWDPLSVQRVLNEWNDQFTAPRVFSYQDSADHTRIRGQIVMTWWQGHTVAQLDHFLRSVIGAATNLSQCLEEKWQNVPRLTPDTTPEPNGVGLSGEDRGVSATEAMAEQFITDGNPFGFLAGDTSAVTTQRIAKDFASRSGQLSPVDDDGVLRITWGDPDINISVNGDVLTVSSSAEVMLADPEDPGFLLPLTWRWSTNRAGAVAVVHRNTDGSTSVIYALHQFVGAGMTDRQLTVTMSQTCELVADCMMGLADDITNGYNEP